MLAYILFDCDGTLVDSEILAQRATLNLLIKRGIPLSAEVYSLRYAGLRGEEIVSLISREYNHDFPEDFIDEMNYAIHDRIYRDLEPINGVRELLEGITIPKAVVSNGSLRHVQSSLNKVQLSHHFNERYFTYDMVPKPKPAPDVYLHALQELSLQPHETVVIEDSPTGVKAAVGANIPVIGFAGASHVGNGHRELLQEYGAQYLASDFTELKRILAEQFWV